MINKLKLPAYVRLLCALFCFAGAAGSTKAAFIAYICDDALCTGGGDTIVTDQGVGDNFPGSAIVGQINSGAINVGGFTIVTNVAQSKPLIGSTSQPQLDLTFSAVTSDNLTHTIFLFASDTGFLSGGQIVLTLGGTQPPGSGSVTGRAWGGNSNANLDMAKLLASFSSSSTPYALSSTATLSPVATPFALTIGVQITRSAAGTTNGDLNLSPVPEPSSVILFGLGLIGLVWVRRRGVHAKA